MLQVDGLQSHFRDISTEAANPQTAQDTGDTPDWIHRLCGIRADLLVWKHADGHTDIGTDVQKYRQTCVKDIHADMHPYTHGEYTQIRAQLQIFKALRSDPFASLCFS